MVPFRRIAAGLACALAVGVHRPAAGQEIPAEYKAVLTTLGKGVITQPWQGTGALRDNGHGQLVPFVLTAGRREHMASREVTGLDLLRLEGFDCILVCREKDAFAGGGGDGGADVIASLLAGEQRTEEGFRMDGI